MNRWIIKAVPAILLIVAVFGASMHDWSTEASEPASQCGTGYVWSLPVSIAYDVPGEHRDIETIATQMRMRAMVLATHNLCVARGGSFPQSIDPLLRGATRDTLIPERCGLTSTETTDAWDRPIFWAVVADSLIVISAGPDGIFGTSDDIGQPSAGASHSRAFTSPDLSSCRTW